jgi:hypothetical protein
MQSHGEESQSGGGFDARAGGHRREPLRSANRPLVQWLGCMIGGFAVRIAQFTRALPFASGTEQLHRPAVRTSPREKAKQWS